MIQNLDSWPTASAGLRLVTRLNTAAVDIDSATFTDPVSIMGDSIAVEGLVATGNAVTLRAGSGAVTDGGGTTDVTAASLAVSATGGVGSVSDPLDTVISNLGADGGSGGVFVSNTGDLTLGGVDGGLSGVMTTNAAIDISAASEITVDEPIDSGGADVLLTATSGVTLNDAVNTAGGDFTVDADSDDDGSGTLSLAEPVMGSWRQVGDDIDGEAASDESGRSVALSADGSRIAIGASRNSGNGSSSGHVRLYDWNGSAWVQVGGDINGESVPDQSGFSVALSADGNRVAIGAPSNSGNGTQAGHVRLYDWNGSAWVQVGDDIDGEAADDQSGWSVSLSADGNRVAIGANQNDGNGSNSGHVRLFDWDGSAWVQVGGDIDGESVLDESGHSVALSTDGNRVAIGARRNGGNGNSSGHVRLYDWNGAAWVQVGSDIDGEAAFDQSGHSVSLSADGNRVAIGAFVNAGSGTNSGHVRLYDWNGTSWVQVGSDIDGDAAGDLSGWSVALSADGNRVAIGSSDNGGNGSDSGHVRLYDWNGSSWVQAGGDINGEMSGDRSGRAVSLSANGSRMAIGAPFNDGNGGFSGHVRLYDFVPGIAGGSIAASGGNVSITAADVELSGTVSGTGSLAIVPSQAGTSIGLGGGAGTLNLGDTELGFLADGFSSITIGDATNTAAVDIDSATFTDPVSIIGDAIAVEGLVATGNAVTLTADSGAVTDGGGTTDVTAASLAVSATAGVGTSGDALDTVISNLAAGGGSGGVFVSNIGDLTLGGVDGGLSGVAANNATIDIRAASEITVDEPIQSGGADVLLTATSGVTLNDAVNTGGGDFTVDADSDDNGSGTFNVAEPVMGGWTQVGDDIDGESAQSRSGWSVSLSDDGSRVAIGGHRNDGNGSSSGHVRLYDWIGNTWVQVGNDIDGEAAFDESGFSVALSADGNRVAIGAPFNAGNGQSSGHVRLYEWNGTDWVQVGSDIDGEAADDRSGWSVSLSADGSRVAIGAYRNDGTGSGSSREFGHVRVYDWNGVDWVQVGGDIDGEAAFDWSGYSVSLSDDGSRVAVGATLNDESGNSSGQVRLYDWNGTAWVQVGGDIDGEAAEDESGYSVSLSADGNRVAIGAPDNDGSGSDAGHVRLYDWNGTAWVQVGSDIDGEAAGDRSGISVSLSADGNRVAIGANLNDDNGSSSGHVRLYDWDGSAWVRVGNDIDGETANDRSGESVSLSADGSRVAIGAWGNDANGNVSGHVRLYDFAGSSGGSIAASGGNVSITAADVDLGGTVSGTGALTIAPSQAGSTIGVGGGAGTLNLDDADLASLVDGFSLITIGNATSGTVNLDTVTIQDALTIVGSTINDAPSGTDVTAPSVTFDGNVSPGQSPGTLLVAGDVTFASGDTFTVEIDGTAGPGVANGHDQLQVSGDNRTITLNGMELAITLNVAPPVGSGEVYTIIDSTGLGSTISGAFQFGGNTLNDGDRFTVGGTAFQINYLPGGDVTLTEAAPTEIEDLDIATNNEVNEEAVADGDYIGLQADSDSRDGSDITYSLDDDAGGRFTIVNDNSSATFDGRVVVADASLIDFESSGGFYDIMIRATDGSGLFTTKSFTIQVVNAAPTAEDDTFDTFENAPISDRNVLLANPATTGMADSDPKGGTLTVSAVDDGATNVGNEELNVGEFVAGSNGGTFRISANGNLAFDPGADFDDLQTSQTRTTSINYTISDGNLTSTATITVTVLGTNDTPTLAPNSFGIPENAPGGATVGDITAIDPDDAETDLTYTLSGFNAGHFEIDEDGIITVAAPSQLDADVQNSYQLVVTVSDDEAATSFGLVFITLTPTNDGPDLSDDFITTNEDTAVTFNVLGNDSDPEDDPLAVTDVAGTPISSTGTTTVALTEGDLEVAADGTITFTPTPDYNGPFSFTYTATDGTTPVTATVNIDVLPVNDAPVAVDDSDTTDEDTAVTVDLVANDSDSDGTLSLAALGIVIGPSSGTIVNHGDGTVTYTPASDFNGSDSFTYIIADDDGRISNVATVSIMVLPVNDAPVVDDAKFSISEDASITDFVGIVNAIDIDSSSLDYDIIAGNADGKFAINPSTGEITLAAGLDFEDVTSYTLTVEVGDQATPELTDLATITINVTDVNEAPVVPGNIFNIDENVDSGTVVGTVTASDEDFGQSLSFAITAGDPQGDFAIDSTTGQITTAGDIDFEEMATYNLTVTVTDSGGPSQSTSAAVTLNINDVLDESGPQVTSVRVNSTAWDPEFRDLADGSYLDGAAVGYVIPTGASQLDTLPWTNINQIIIGFSEDVSSSLDASDFELRVTAGVRADQTVAGIPSIVAASWDATNLQAVLTLSQSIEPAVIDLNIDDAGVTDAFGNLLDGEWINETTTGNSGDSVSGGDFSFELRVLPGDVANSSFEFIDGDDINGVSGNIGGVIIPGVGAFGEVLFSNINGDRFVNGLDVGGVQTRNTSRLLPATFVRSVSRGAMSISPTSNSQTQTTIQTQADRLADEAVQELFEARVHKTQDAATIHPSPSINLDWLENYDETSNSHSVDRAVVEGLDAYLAAIDDVFKKDFTSSL